MASVAAKVASQCAGGRSLFVSNQSQNVGDLAQTTKELYDLLKSTEPSSAEREELQLRWAEHLKTVLLAEDPAEEVKPKIEVEKYVEYLGGRDSLHSHDNWVYIGEAEVIEGHRGWYYMPGNPELDALNFRQNDLRISSVKGQPRWSNWHSMLRSADQREALLREIQRDPITNEEPKSLHDTEDEYVHAYLQNLYNLEDALRAWEEV